MNRHIVFEAPTPKYLLIQNHIIEQIETGALKPGDKISSENELAIHFNVSRVTGNAAITGLANYGYVERIRGKGTFVNTKEKYSSYGSFNGMGFDKRNISGIGIQDNHKLLSVDIIPCPKTVAKVLTCKPGQNVYKIIRLMNDGTKHIAVDCSYLPESMASMELVKEKTAEMYFHIFLKEFCHVEPYCLYTRIWIEYAGEAEQKYLHASANEPLLVIENTVYNKTRTALGVTYTTSRPTDYQPYLNFII